MHNLGGPAFQAAPLLQEEQQQLRCPRCDSTNTKFCYYNNYNLSQPRHFCRDCRRYWTRGGVLRNVPVGGGTRKSSKRPAYSSSSSSSSSPSKRSSTLPSSPTPAATVVAPITTLSAAPPRIPGGVLSLLSATNLGHPIGSRPSMELHGLRVVGDRSENMAAPPSGTPVSEASLRLQGDSNCRNGGGGGWPDLSIFTPGSKFQ